ncbi:CD2BP2 [Mytilus edulis]|uniref:CD2BP2 n=1 Tax=Mytilus edulis TaxID=6550 RepID=A0A8S3T9X2_MYTED|nr:CD2BP2 [Mytilus edulis]
MSKRKRFEQDREEDLRDFEDLDDEAARRFKDKHSLDSDEEDENTGKYDILDEDDIEGQEDGTMDFDGEIQITPFNMKEELEEGHFDKQGIEMEKSVENLRRTSEEIFTTQVHWTLLHVKDSTINYVKQTYVYSPVNNIWKNEQNSRLKIPCQVPSSSKYCINSLPLTAPFAFHHLNSKETVFLVLYHIY